MTTTSTDRRSGAFLQAAIKLPCRVVAVADITLSGLQTIDGVALAADDRVLVTGQDPSTENGIYVADTGAWARSSDCNGSRDLVQGTIVAVVAGTLYTGSVWQVTTASPVVGSALAWSRMGASALALASAFMLTLLDDVDAATARTTLGVPSTTEAILKTIVDAAGDLIYGSAADTVARLAIGTTDQFLGITSGLPAWKAAPPAPQTRFINGDFSIDQRNEGAAQTFTAAAAVAYTVDRWYASCTGANITGQRVAGTATNQYAYRFTGATSNTGLLFGQRIESVHAADLVNSDVTVSFQVKSSTLSSLTWNVYSADVADVFSAKTLVATGTITGISSTLASKNFTFNAGANAARGLAIEFVGGALIAAQTLQFEAAQCEPGTVVTAFRRQTISERLRACQRYYRKSYAPGTVPATATAIGMVGGVAMVNGVFFGNAIVDYGQPMRATPTNRYWDSAGTLDKLSFTPTTGGTGFTANLAITIVAPFNAGPTGFALSQISGTPTGNCYLHYEADAEV